MFFDAESSSALLVTDKKETHDYGASAVELGLNDEGAVDESGNALPGKVAKLKLNVEKAGVYAVAFDILQMTKIPYLSRNFHYH